MYFVFYGNAVHEYMTEFEENTRGILKKQKSLKRKLNHKSNQKKKE